MRIMKDGMLNEEIVTETELAALQVPVGNAVVLPAGSRIYITQMLGNSITAATDIGMVRIARAEAECAGICAPETPREAQQEPLTLEQKVWNALSSVYDPEIPVDIVNLGLVYSVEVIEQKEGGACVNVRMTLTAPGCGMGPHLMAEAEAGIAALEGVSEVNVDFVWDPPWNQDMMTEEAKMQLGML